jgi:hypothetical protein
VRIVDEAEDRSLLGQLREESQAGRRDEKAVVPRGLADPESTSQSICLRARERLKQGDGWPDQLMQRRKREVGLRLDPPGCENVHVLGPVTGVRKQRALADPRFAAQDERAAL